MGMPILISLTSLPQVVVFWVLTPAGGDSTILSKRWYPISSQPRRIAPSALRKSRSQYAKRKGWGFLLINDIANVPPTGEDSFSTPLGSYAEGFCQKLV